MNIGDQLPLTDEQKQEVVKLFDKAEAYQQTIKMLSADSYSLQMQAWDLIRKWYPETKGHKIQFDRASDMSVTIIEKLPPAPVKIDGQ